MLDSLRSSSNDFKQFFKREILKNNIQDIKNIKPEIWLIFILLFGLFLRLHFFIGLNWSDDVNYVDIANQILRGSYYPSYPKTLRLMIIYPIAFFFKIFGISNLSGALYPLICSLLSIISVFYFGKKIFGVDWVAFRIYSFFFSFRC
jgi:4-amino-4-deoxy-L-arabinose transferase-like glycosyltransferase